MRGFIIFLVFLGVVVLAGFIGFSRVPDMLASKLSKKLGVSVSVESVGLSTKQISIEELVIGNINGYFLPKSFSAEKIEIDAPVTNYFKDDVVIDEVEVNDIYLGLEFDSPTGTKGNWNTIMDNFAANVETTKAKDVKVTIKKLILTNIETDLVFKSQGNQVRKLPKIDRIELTNISTEGGFPTDQLMGSVLGQMIKQVFTQQRLGNLVDEVLDVPSGTVDSIFKLFKN